MTFGRRAQSFAAVLAIHLAWAVPAHAEPSQPAGVRLSWVRTAEAATCITPQALEHQVAERLGWNPFEGETRQWIEGLVVLDGDEYQVELFERDEAGSTVGSRVLRSSASDCRSLDEAASLAIALIIDPSATLQPRRAEGAAPAIQGRSDRDGPGVLGDPARTGVSKAETETLRRLLPSHSSGSRCRAPALRCPVLPTGERHPKDSRDRSSAMITATPVAMIGVTPETAYGIESAGEAPWGGSGLAVRLGMTYLPERWEDQDEGEIGYGLTAAQLGLCWSTLGLRLRGFGCATLEAGAIHTAVRQPDPLEPGDRFWSVGRIHAGVRLRTVGPLWIEARAFSGVPFRRLAFRVRVDGEPREVYTQSWWVLGLGIGLGLHFG